jgi:hypothetical protein
VLANRKLYVKGKSLHKANDSHDQPVAWEHPAVDEAQLDEVFRQWFIGRLQEHGGKKAAFAKATTIPKSSVTNVVDGDRAVTMDMVLRIANKIGPPMHEIFADVAQRCFAMARGFSDYATVANRVAVRAEDQKLLEAAAAVEGELESPADEEDAPLLEPLAQPLEKPVRRSSRRKQTHRR